MDCDLEVRCLSNVSEVMVNCPSYVSVYCSAVVRKKVLVVFQGCDYAVDS